MSDNTEKEAPARTVDELKETQFVGQGTQHHQMDETLPPDQQKQAGATGILPEEFGHYRIKKELGRGAMGTVYLALDTKLDRDVALKVPRFGPDDGADEVQRFYREARAMATLRHPNLCPVHEVGEVDGHYYLTMAFIEGTPLSAYLKKGKPLKDRQTAALTRKLAIALQKAHDKDIVHRDLKPDNIMIDTDKEPVIMDFGLARRRRDDETQLTQAGTIMGTPSYMSPEQVEGDQDKIGPQTDVYALGVILYQMVCGKLPFEGSLAAVLGKIAVQEPDPPSTLNKQLSPALEEICLKAMSKKLADRYGSASELVDELTRFLRGDQPNAAPVEDLEETPKRIEPASQATIARTDQLVTDLFEDLAGDGQHQHTTVQEPPSIDTVPPKRTHARQLPTRVKEQRRLGWLHDRRILIGGGVGFVLLFALVVVLSNLGSDDKLAKKDPGRNAGEDALKDKGENNKAPADPQTGDHALDSPPGTKGSSSEQLKSVSSIWNSAPHNAYTDLCYFRNSMFCVFREGTSSNSTDGKLRIISSNDGDSWASAAQVELAKSDLRDPKLCELPDGRLMLTATARSRPLDHTLAWTSEDGISWSDEARIGDTNRRLWRFAWKGGVGYSVGYENGKEQSLQLYRGDSPEQLRPYLNGFGPGTESALAFRQDGSLLALVRGRSRSPANLGVSSAPYRNWDWKKLDQAIAGPAMLVLSDQRIVVGGRLNSPNRTALLWLDPNKNKLTEFLTLPSGGSTGYPGLLVHRGFLWVSYYSSHEGKSKIYLAKVRLGQ